MLQSVGIRALDCSIHLLFSWLASYISSFIFQATPISEEVKRRAEEGWINAPIVHVDYSEVAEVCEKCSRCNAASMNSFQFCEGICFPSGLRDGNLGKEEVRRRA
jgi:hypothetical protein